MPVLIDLSNVLISTLMAQLGNHKNAEVNEDQLRHMTLNVIRANRKKFSEIYGEVVLCADGKRYWRKEIFPYYKAARKEHREASELNWPLIFDTLNKLKTELKDYLPYKIIDIDTAEADDVIASICMAYGKDLGGEKFLILSSDKDMAQLQYYSNIDQFDPVNKKWVRRPNVDQALFEHIVKGDRGDGIPNILSADDTFVTGVRQRPITKKKIEAWFQDPSQMDDEAKRNFERNKMLISFECIPKDLQQKIVSEYETQTTAGRGKLFDYFIQNRLRYLIETVQDF